MYRTGIIDTYRALAVYEGVITLKSTLWHCWYLEYTYQDKKVDPWRVSTRKPKRYME